MKTIFTVVLLAFLGFTTSFCALSSSFDQIPEEVLQLILSIGYFKDIKTLVSVSKRFRLVVPRLYYRYFEQVCVDFSCGLLVSPEEAVDLSLTPWAIIGLDEDDTLTTEQKVAETAFLMMYTGFKESLSLKIRSHLFKYINTDARKRLFKDALNATLINIYAEIPWEFSAMSVYFTDFNPFLYTSYHIPLLELGCHPRTDEVLVKVLAVVVHFDGGVLEADQLARIGEAEHPMYQAAALTLQGSFIDQQRLMEHCLYITDAVYFFHGPEKADALLSFFNEILEEEFQFEYDEYSFQTRIEEDQDNIYRLLVTLELIAISPDDLIARLRHPLVLPSFLPFSTVLQNIVYEFPINIKGYTPLMLDSLRCFLRLPIHRQYRSYMSHAIWRTEDNVTIGLLLSCGPICYAADFFKRATAKKGEMVMLPLAFGDAHWPLIFRFAFAFSDVLTYLIDWIAFDLRGLISSRDPLSVAHYISVPQRCFAFNQIFIFACHLLISNNRFTDDEVWTLRSLFPEKCNHFIIGR